MPIVIKTEKVWQDGKECYKVLSFSGVVRWIAYPNAYICTCPNVTPTDSDYRVGSPYVLCEGVEIDKGQGSPFKLLVGDIVPKAKFEDCITTIREAGERLHQINKKLKWGGEEVFTI